MMKKFDTEIFFASTVDLEFSIHPSSFNSNVLTQAKRTFYNIQENLI